MIELTGDLFTSTAPAVAHGVNCAGLMGAGIAKTMRANFPHNYENYKAACDAGQLKPGGLCVNFEHGVYILNMASQNKPGRDASYPWVFESALAAVMGAVNVGVDRIAVPEVGCGIGGLKWENVKAILSTTELIVNNRVQWEVWHYGKS